MTTITHTRRARVKHRVGNGRVARDVERIIKKAMIKTRAAGIQRRLKNYLVDSVENAKYKTRAFHRDVANYTYKKPYTTIGIALLTGAAIAYILDKTKKTRSRGLFG